jgi:hypothetical protein
LHLAGSPERPWLSGFHGQLEKTPKFQKAESPRLFCAPLIQMDYCTTQFADKKLALNIYFQRRNRQPANKIVSAKDIPLPKLFFTSCPGGISCSPPINPCHS